MHERAVRPTQAIVVKIKHSKHNEHRPASRHTRENTGDSPRSREAMTVLLAVSFIHFFLSYNIRCFYVSFRECEQVGILYLHMFYSFTIIIMIFLVKSIRKKTNLELCKSRGLTNEINIYPIWAVDCFCFVAALALVGQSFLFLSSCLTGTRAHTQPRETATLVSNVVDKLKGKSKRLLSSLSAHQTIQKTTCCPHTALCAIPCSAQQPLEVPNSKLVKTAHCKWTFLCCFFFLFYVDSKLIENFVCLSKRKM